MLDPSDALLSVGGAARLLEVSAERVRALDSELTPFRLDSGTGARVYLRSRVIALAEKRAQRAAAALSRKTGTTGA